MPLGLGRLVRKVGPVGSAVIAMQVASATREHWESIPRAKRKRLQTLLRKSGGKPSNLTAAERRELRKLVRALDLSSLARKSMLTATGIHRQLRSSPDSDSD